MNWYDFGPQITPKYKVGQKVFAIFGMSEFNPEEIEIRGVRIDANYEGDKSYVSISYRDKYSRYINESRCYLTKDDLIEQFKNNIKHL